MKLLKWKFLVVSSRCSSLVSAARFRSAAPSARAEETRRRSGRSPQRPRRSAADDHEKSERKIAAHDIIATGEFLMTHMTFTQQWTHSFKFRIPRTSRKKGFLCLRSSAKVTRWRRSSGCWAPPLQPSVTL